MSCQTPLIPIEEVTMEKIEMAVRRIFVVSEGVCSSITHPVPIWMPGIKRPERNSAGVPVNFSRILVSMFIP